MSSLIREVSDIANGLKEAQWKLSDVQALEIAVKIQNNRVLSDCFCVSAPGSSVSYPTCLEAIAIALGYKDKLGEGSVINGIYEIARAIDETSVSAALDTLSDTIKGKDFTT